VIACGWNQVRVVGAAAEPVIKYRFSAAPHGALASDDMSMGGGAQRSWPIGVTLVALHRIGTQLIWVQDGVAVAPAPSHADSITPGSGMPSPLSNSSETVFVPIAATRPRQ